MTRRNCGSVATRQPIGNPLIGYALAFSPDGKTLATGSYSHIIRLWNVLSRTGMAALTSKNGAIYATAFSRDGKTLAAGSADGTVRLWNVTTRHQSGALNGRAGAVYSVAFSPDSRTLATGNTDGTVRLWDVTTRQQSGAALNGARRDGLLGGVQPRREDPGCRQRRRDGAAVGRDHRAADRRPIEGQ